MTPDPPPSKAPMKVGAGGLAIAVVALTLSATVFDRPVMVATWSAFVVAWLLYLAMAVRIYRRHRATFDELARLHAHNDELVGQLYDSLPPGEATFRYHGGLWWRITRP